MVVRSAQNVVFGHNDLQPGNVLVNETTHELTLIDFEYARSVPRGYDIINGWCEWAADYHGPTPHLMNYNTFPTLEQQQLFALHYLTEMKRSNASASVVGSVVSKEEIEHVIQEARHFEQLSHLWWGVWSLTQATQSTIDFDYIGYGKCRLDGF